jgi:hypothetical protein
VKNNKGETTNDVDGNMEKMAEQRMQTSLRCHRFI